MKTTRMQQFHSWLAVKSESVLFGLTGILILIIFCILLFTLGCASTMETYFKERVDKGIVFEGRWEKTGIIIKAPGEQLSSGSITLGREVGWGCMTGQPLATNDAMLYEHVEGLTAGNEQVGADIDSKTTVRNERVQYLGPERASP